MNVTTTPQRPVVSPVPARAPGAEALPPSIRNRLARAGLTSPTASAKPVPQP